MSPQNLPSLMVYNEEVGYSTFYTRAEVGFNVQSNGNLTTITNVHPG